MLEEFGGLGVVFVEGMGSEVEQHKAPIEYLEEIVLTGVARESIVVKSLETKELLDDWDAQR